MIKSFAIQSLVGVQGDPEGFYFFGVKNETPEYIESYEKEYGIIFEFITTRPYKLLALDKKETLEKLYQNASEEIRRILDNNYGYTNGLRNSESNSDRKLSEYICRQGYHGYAIKDMATDFDGSFHPEFMFCDISGINYVKKVTSDVRVNEILEREKEKTFSKKLKEERRNKRYSYQNAEEPDNLENLENVNSEKRRKPKFLFMDDDDDDNKMEMGGSKRRKHKKRKTLRKTNKKRRMTMNKQMKKRTRKIRKSNRKGK